MDHQNHFVGSDEGYSIDIHPYGDAFLGLDVYEPDRLEAGINLSWPVAVDLANRILELNRKVNS